MIKYIRTILAFFFDCILALPFLNINLLQNRLIRKIEEDGNVFFTVHQRPKKSNSFKIKPQLSLPSPLTAIVLQGPLITEDDFTFETILFYKNNFNNSVIVVSTWIDEDKSLIKKIETTGVTVVLNKKPDCAGTQNINYQIKSSIAGILKAKELGVEYVLKTRTDQRIYGLNVMDYFFSLTEIFPLKEVNVQKRRLIVPNMNTFLYRMYGISDMTMFGYIDDMVLYWDANYDKRNLVIDPKKRWDLKSFAELRICEIYLCTEFLKKNGKKIQWTLEDSWQAIADHFCVIDYHSIDIYWPKYFPQKEFRNKYYATNNTHQLISFIDWLSLYNNRQQKPSPEILGFIEGEPFLI